MDHQPKLTIGTPLVPICPLPLAFPPAVHSYIGMLSVLQHVATAAVPWEWLQMAAITVEGRAKRGCKGYNRVLAPSTDSVDARVEITFTEVGWCLTAVTPTRVEPAERQEIRWVFRNPGEPEFEVSEAEVRNTCRAMAKLGALGMQNVSGN